MTKSERLLHEIDRRGGMNGTEIRKFILDMRFGFNSHDYIPSLDANTWGSTLHGNRKRVGILERFCARHTDGTYYVVRHIAGPFSPRR